MNELEVLTPEIVIRRYQWTSWVKNTPTKIRPFTEQDRTTIGPTFCDLEGREHQVIVGRALCVGLQGERWTTSIASLERDRVAVSGPDSEGFRLYQMRNPQPVKVFDVPHPFMLVVRGESWSCEDAVGGYITWNGKQGAELVMRVNQRSTFQATYAQDPARPAR
jgi:hypothetical protein